MSKLVGHTARAYASAEEMTSASNRTKWRRLFQALLDSDPPFGYRCQHLDGSTLPSRDESTPELEAVWATDGIEFLDVFTIQKRRIGALLKEEVFDYTREAIESAHQAGETCSLIPGGIGVWGYIRKSNQPEFVERV